MDLFGCLVSFIPDALADENALAAVPAVSSAYDELVLAFKKEVYCTIVTASVRECPRILQCFASVHHNTQHAAAGPPHLSTAIAAAISSAAAWRLGWQALTGSACSSWAPAGDISGRTGITLTAGIEAAGYLRHPFQRGSCSWRLVSCRRTPQRPAVSGCVGPIGNDYQLRQPPAPNIPHAAFPRLVCVSPPLAKQ